MSVELIACKVLNCKQYKFFFLFRKVVAKFLKLSKKNRLRIKKF